MMLLDASLGARSGARPGLIALICVLIIQIIFVIPTRADHTHLHVRHHDLHHEYRASRREATGSDEDPAAMVKNALAVLAQVNRDRVQNPNFNQYGFQDTEGAKQNAVTAAPPLDYSPEAADDLRLKARETSSTATTSGNQPYSIPPELAEAARIIAESTDNTPTGNHSEVAAELRKKYGKGKRLSNTPPQTLVRSNGLYDFQSLGESGNGSSNAEPVYTELSKRATSSYWMADITKNGVSPFAPDGYKIWRNVRDYGAKGDGVTDDTAAINKAISDGGRCGAACGSSTIYPAVIWFPSGKYLVSSPIIQYYNTQFLGDPLNVPTILAASSFVGLGVITSDVYVSDTEEWYVNQNNFLRTIRNFIIDIRPTDPYAYVCAIHWQVAQGTSLENIVFYMLYNSDVPGNTQQGIYMENGSGGFLTDLTFIGGNFGAYFGNQQFTTSQLVFTSCNTALQVHWDWAWTMQDYIIVGCTNGLVIVGGAGGPMSTGQGVGSLVLADAMIYDTKVGIVTSLYAENSTSLLLQNVGFYLVESAIVDDVKNEVLLPGGSQVLVDSWGFGMVSDATGVGTFMSGQNIPAMNRTDAMLGSNVYVAQNLYTRRRPLYEDLKASEIINVKLFGAKGDGSTDDTVILNHVLSFAANLSSVVYFPFGVYIITDTLQVPVGSRIVGQAWSQIMAKGAKFQDVDKPRVAVKVGTAGDVGVVEIQDLMFTVSGPTAGAVLVEWNIEQSTKGSAAMWDSHIRVGGAIGSNLQKAQCPKNSGKVNPDCIAASLLLHLTPSSTAYLENIWVWVADHDMDLVTQDQIDVYSARGILVESQLAWLYGTASEHNVLYQYQLSGAKNILMAMIQTESPYYQPNPLAPNPFTPGGFPNDPQFGDCTTNPLTCAVSWAVRIVDSSNIWILGSGLYSWFSDYSQDCLKTENCQQRGFEIEESYDIWIYNLCTKAIVEMVSPFQGKPTNARNNVNGFLSSILAWLGGANQTAGERDFPGFSIYNSNVLEDVDLPVTCKNSLMEKFKCDSYLTSMMDKSYHGSLYNDTLTESICAASCGTSLAQWYTNVERNCAGYNISGSPPMLYGGRMWAAYNETCSKDKDTGEYCNDIIAAFTLVDTVEQMKDSEICSFCYVSRLQMMQRTPYSGYNEYFQTVLEAINKHCGLSGPTEILTVPVDSPEEEDPICLSDVTYVTAVGDTCDSIAGEYSVSSASLYMGNQYLILNCASIEHGLELCIPTPCETTYTLQASDNCTSVERAFNLETGDLRKYNPWISYDCDNLETASAIYGSNICLSPQGGKHTSNETGGDTTTPSTSGGYVINAVAPPDNATVADGTTTNCGRWHETVADEDCVAICLQDEITYELFVAVNPSLNAVDCDGSMQVGKTYCTGPTYLWNVTVIDSSSAIPSPTTTA